MRKLSDSTSDRIGDSTSEAITKMSQKVSEGCGES